MNTGSPLVQSLKRKEKKTTTIKEFLNYPSELPTPISKIKRWFMEVILSASITGVSI